MSRARPDREAEPQVPTEAGRQRARRSPEAEAGIGAPNGRGELSPEAALALQRAIGNHAVAELIAAQRASGQDAPGADVPDVLNRPGAPLDAPLREDMEARLGADFSTVRVHTDVAAQRSAADLGARAYTSGEHIVIGEGGGDRHTLAHELEHVKQQRSGPVAGSDNGAGLSVSHPSDSFERAAEKAATKALSGPVPDRGAAAPVQRAAAHGQFGGRSGLMLQLVRISDVQAGLSETDTTHIADWMARTELDVSVSIPSGTAAATRSTTLNSGRATDSRLDPDLGVATITWNQLLRGDVVRMSHGPRDVYVQPHSGEALGDAVEELHALQRLPQVANDAVLGPWTTQLMDWLAKKRGSHGGDMTVATVATTSDDGPGAHVSMGGRPGWDDTANEIVTTSSEDRRHIIAWHTMRDAFQNVFNQALGPGEDIRDRMIRLNQVLNDASTWAQLDAAEQEADSSSDVEMADATQEEQEEGDSQHSAMSGVITGGSPAPSVSGASGTSSTASTSSVELRDRLTGTITRVMGLLSNNPYNLWAGESLANQSINRVGQQLSARLAEFEDDGELIAAVRDRAGEGAATGNQDQNVWTQVRDTLQDVQATDARKFIQSIVDSFDIDIPVTDEGTTSSTYRDQADQAAAVRNVLATGLAQEVLRMSDGTLPQDFDKLIDDMGNWLRKYLRPESLQTGKTQGRRTVGARPQNPGS